MDELRNRINARIAEMESKSTTLYDLATLYRAENKITEAERVERQAGEIASESYGLNDAIGIMNMMETER